MDMRTQGKDFDRYVEKCEKKRDPVHTVPGYTPCIPGTDKCGHQRCGMPRMIPVWSMEDEVF